MMRIPLGLLALLLAACNPSATDKVLQVSRPQSFAATSRATALAQTRSITLQPGQSVVITAAVTAPDTIIPPKDTTPAPPPAIARPLAYGSFHLPNDQFPRFTGALRALTTTGAKADLAAAKKTGLQLVVSLPGSRAGYINADQTFNLAKWKQRMDAWKPLAPLLNAYADSGTILLNYLIDEPFCSSCYGGKAITVTDVKAVIAYGKALFPRLPTTIRVAASDLKARSSNWPGLDAAWSQYEGALHDSKLTPAQYRDREVAAAKALDLNLVLGYNTLNGGDGSSRINGTFAQDPILTDAPSSKYRYQMSAKEASLAGKTFVQSTACAVLTWRWSPTSEYGTGIKDYDLRPAIVAVTDSVTRLAKTVKARSCRRPS